MNTALQIQNLHKHYANHFHALKDISLKVEKKDFFALLGPNGAGKSTLIGIISSLVNWSSGTIKIYDYDLQTQASQAKALIGLVPQELNLNQFERVIDVLLIQAGYYGIPKKVAYDRAVQNLTLMELWDARDIHVHELSGGMKRRLMIARALMHKPQLLILDEPTAGVDVEVRQLIWSCMNELNKQGTTIILTTHYLEEAEKWCRNIAIINDGEMLEHTTMRLLLDKLKQETYMLYLKKALNTLPVLKNGHLNFIDSLTLELILSNQQTLSPVFAELTRHGIEVSVIDNKSSRLEELFLQLIK